MKRAVRGKSVLNNTSGSPFESETTQEHKPASGDEMEDRVVVSSDNRTQADDTLGQFSYGPATQTTVVTTTTTTTTKFPPLMLRAPRHLEDLDPKMYPLAASPTPASIRKLHFSIEGKPATFEEAHDTAAFAQEVSPAITCFVLLSTTVADPLGVPSQIKEQESALARSSGSLRTVSDQMSNPETSSASRPKISAEIHPSSEQKPGVARKTAFKRSASPVSISDAATLVAQERPRKKRMTSQGKKQTNMEANGPTPKLSRSRLQIMQTSTPITPHIGNDGIDHVPPPPVWGRLGPRELDLEAPRTSRSSSAFENSPEPEGDPQILSPRSECEDEEQGDGLSDDNHPDLTQSDLSADWPGEDPPVTVTPHVEDDVDLGMRGSSPRLSQMEQPRVRPRPRPHTLDTTAVQDASLPSPSLSPVTAAATSQSRRGYFDQQAANLLSRPSLGNHFVRPQLRRDPSFGVPHGNPGDDPGPSSNPVREIVALEREYSTPKHADSSLMCIPQLVDSFERMPEEMKKYVMYQLLRRSSKPVIHFVAGVVNPALKCDFLKYLPPELSEVILGHLDVKSLCSASQVSKRWHQQLDSSEKVWQQAFYASGFTLEEGELPRAIREGWGWQTVSDPGEAEQDLSSTNGGVSDTEASASLALALRDVTNLPALRGKRKGKAKGKHASRLSRKKNKSRTYDSLDLDEDSILAMSSITDGPYAAANAAAAAISLPRSNLHLWKSIYMRHYIIRKTWLQDQILPRHIAFRAHQRHVVTCLQFDSEKILTGSDDANINVYDTQTGALRVKLEGHEGGVWALQYEGNVLVSGSTDRCVRVWDIEKGICTHTFQGHTSTVRCLQILMPTPVGTSMDGRVIKMPKQPLIITGSRDSNLRVWKLPKPGDPQIHQAGPAPDEATECPYFVRTLTGHHHSVRAIAAHGDTLVSGSYDCSVRVWKISTGETMHRLAGHTQKVYSVVLDHKRNRCISGSMDNVVKVWSLDTGMALFNLEGHSSLVGLLDLQQDRLVSAAADSTLRIWDPDTGRCRSTLSAHTGAITCFQHDGQKVISGSDRTLKMWNVATGDFVKDLLTDLSGVWQVKFNERRCVAAVQRKNFTFIEVNTFPSMRLHSWYAND